VLLSRLISDQPVGAEIGAEPGKRAYTEAISTSPEAVVAGRETASVEPYVAAVVTAPPVGIALRPGPAPAITVPITSASPRTGSWRWRRRGQLLGDQVEARLDGTAV
jgi:hypothetical protein